MKKILLGLFLSVPAFAFLTPIGGSAIPSGPASGSLAGTYPGPTLAGGASNPEVGYLVGVTAAIQSQINTNSTTITTHSAQIAALQGATSSLQTQATANAAGVAALQGLTGGVQTQLNTHSAEIAALQGVTGSYVQKAGDAMTAQLAVGVAASSLTAGAQNILVGATVAEIRTNSAATTRGILLRFVQNPTVTGTDVGSTAIIGANMVLSPLAGITVTNTTSNGYFGMRITGPVAPAGVLALTNYGGITIDSNATATGTNKYGVRVSDQSGGTNNYAYFSGAGSVLFGDLAGTGSRAVVADATGLLSAPVSDKRLKRDVDPLGRNIDALAIVQKLRPVTFYWDTSLRRVAGFGSQREIGFIAQEVEKILPEVVRDNHDGYKSVEYEKVVPLLVEAIKKQQEEIEELRRR